VLSDLFVGKNYFENIDIEQNEECSFAENLDIRTRCGKHYLRQ
jgi:hypothetical protein